MFQMLIVTEVFKFTIVCCTGAVVVYLVRLVYLRQEDNSLKMFGLKSLLLCVLAAFSVG